MFGADFFKKIKEAQEALANLDERLEQIVVEFSAGGGMVTVVMNGKKELLDIKIDPAVVDPDDVEMLQDLIISAIRGAHSKIEQKVREQMQQIISDIGIDPGAIGGLPV